MPLSKKSPLKSLNCFIDNEGLIRLKGRLSNASELCYDTKFPILISHKNPITELPVRKYHNQNNHLGTETIISDIRKRYWITNLRSLVKKISWLCQHCRNKNAEPETPIMGQLPACRVESSSRPFINTRVDFFGPIEVVIKRSREKRYGVIFTCMCIRAVHIEIANSLTSSDFILVLRQSAARRGYPENIFSDNGTNFTKANKDVQNALKEWTDDDLSEIAQLCTSKL